MSLAAIDPTTAAGAPMRAAAACVSAHGLAKRFGEARVFGDVGFELAAESITAPVGANGARKSTLLRLRLGLIAPGAGEARLFGAPNAARGLRARRAAVGFVAQRHNLRPRLSALTNVIHGLLRARRGPRYWRQARAPAWARDQAMAAQDEVGLAHLALRRADGLSGGQSQRVAVARALVAKPRVLIADEPAAALDPSAGEDVMALFLARARDRGVVVPFTSHHVQPALTYADRVIGLRQGPLTLDAPADRLDVETLGARYG